MGIKSELNNNCEDTKMVPRNIDGEMCLDVECGSNKAVLYVSKLFAGSKKECVFYENEWLTPNEFQNVSGRRSAKYWKRSIRHNGISLKTLMESGLLKAKDDPLPPGDGEHVTIDNNNGTVTEQSLQKKSTKKLKKKGANSTTNTDTDEPTVQAEIGRESDSDTSVTVDHASIDVASGEESGKVPDTTEDYATNTDEQSKDDAKFSNFDQDTQSSSCKVDRPKEIHGKTQGCQADPAVETKETFAQENSQRICDKGEEHEIKGDETRREVIQPYEVTVTPPPTPPSEVIKGQFIGQNIRAAGQKEEEFQHKLTVAFKPYLLDHSNARTSSNTVASHKVIKPREPFNSELNYNTHDLKGGSPVPRITIEHIVTSPGKVNTFHADHRIPPLTNDADRNRNIRDPSSENIHRPHRVSREDRLYRYDTSPYSSITSTNHHSAAFIHTKGHGTTIQSCDHPSGQVFVNDSCKCNSMCRPTKRFSAQCTDICETSDIKHKSLKRQYSDIYDDEPLDLSMKKKRTTSDWNRSRDRDIPVDHTQVTDQNVHNVWKPEHKDLLPEKLTDPEPVIKNMNGAYHPFMNALRSMHFAHSVSKLSPCYCSLCINPVSLYVPYVLDWKHGLEYKI